MKPDRHDRRHAEPWDIAHRLLVVALLLSSALSVGSTVLALDQLPAPTSATCPSSESALAAVPPSA